MSSSLLASPTAENAQKLKEAQLRIGMALKNAQYALTTHAHRGLATALHENVNALTALSMYLTLSGSSVKAAAIAGQMAKILKSVGMYVAAKERSGGASQHAEGSRHSSAPNTPASSSVVLDESRFLTDATRESAGVVQDLHRAMEELTRQRDALAEEKHALEVALEESRQRLAATKSLTAVETHSSDATDRDDDASIRRLRAEVDSLKHEVREEHMRAAALRDQLHEAEEQIEEQQDHVQALKSQLRLSQEEKLSQDDAFAKKEEEIKALQETLLQSSPSTTAPSSRVTSAAVAPPAAPPPRGYVDKDDFDALKLQNQLLQEALRNQPAHARPIDSHTVLSQQTLEEIEADHQQQLEAMKLTIQEQYNRETELLEKQRTMQENVDDLKRQLQLSNNRQWVQQERERHLNEMDAAKMRIEQLQETIHKQDEQIQTQQAQLQHCAENDRKHTDVIKSLKLQHETQLATLNEELRARNDELNETLEAKYDLSTQLEAHRIQTAAAIAAKEEQCNCSQREISGLTLALTALREQHEARVAELQQQLEAERDHAAATQSTVEERECALQQRLTELRTSMTALREQHEARVAELQQEHAAQAAQQQQQLEVEREQHEARVAELQQQLEVERDHAAATQSTVEERECALQQRLTELRTSMTALREQHEARVAELQQEHAAQAAQQQQQLEVEREQHEARVAELQQQLEVERDHAAATQSTVEERECALQQRLTELRTSMTALREQHEARVAELQQEHAAQAAQQQQQLEVEREQHEARVAELQQQLEVERDHAAATQSTVEERECALQQRLTELRTSMTALREQHEARVAELQQEHAAQAAQQQQQLEVEREQHEARVAELQQQLEVERDHAAATQSTVEERECALQQRLTELRTSMTALREQHEARVAELQQEHAAQAAQQQQQLEVEREQHEARVAELQQQLEVERDHAAATQSTVEERECALQQRLTELRTSMTALREQHEARVAELQQEHAAQAAQQQQQLEVEREQHEARVAELQQQLEVERDHAAATQSTVEERECALQQRLTELRTSMTALREQHEARVAELQQEHAAQAAQQQQQLEVEREQHEARVAELQQQLEVERDHAAASQSTVEERECALQQRLAELRTSMTALCEQHEARVAELQQEHAAQAAQQQQQLEVERDHAAASQSTVEERECALQQRLAELRTSMTTLCEQHEARVAELQQEHAAQAAQQQQQLEVEREQHEARVAELQQQLEVERDHAAASQSTVEERECALQQRLTELRTSMTALREQHEARVAELQQEHAAQAAQQQQQLEVEREQHEARVAELQQQLEVERDHAAATQSTVEERECALQQRLTELRTSMTALREQHEARVAELQQQLEAQREEAKRESVRVKAEEAVFQSRVDELEEERKAAKAREEARVEELKAQVLREQECTERGERKVDERRKKVEENSKTVAAVHAAAVQKLKDEHAAALKRAEDGRALDVKHVRREFAEKLAVTSQPVEWLKGENEALKVREKELEEKLKELTSGKMAALARAQEAEQVLSSRKGEVRRLKDECASMQSTMATCLEERDAALKKLKDDAQLTEEAQANLVRLETLRKELKEVQVRLDTAEKDKALLLSRYKRTSTEKDECAEAARKLLTQYKEMAAARERLVSQLAAAEALAAEKSMRVEELTRATIVNAGVTSKGSQDDAPEASTQNALEDTLCEKQDRIKALVTELNEVARENKMLKLELDAAKDRRVAPQQPLLAAEPASTQSAFAQDLLGSLAGMRDILSTMHRQLNPILEQLCAHERARAVAEASPSTSSSAVEALEALAVAMESAHTTMQSTLEDFAAAARQLRVSAELQGVVYGKLLATSAPMPALVDVSLIRACTALLGEVSFGSALGKEKKASHGVLPLVGNGVQHYCSGSTTSVVQDYAAAARKAEGAVAITGSDQSPSMCSHYHADARAPSALASPANFGNPASSAYIVSPACRRADHRERAMLGDFGPGRKASRLGPPLRPSFENFAAAQLAISAAEERAGLRTAPTPPWK
ncbi:hypothetical protein GH5_03198 [Leishmania sp. Ghana 2012 LV757]|uniref:hypothetical protein n=1 Tax=Leishmania sp. Ghana 2012 LV757 TaxID=2803181 RepID=UPI001B76F913|nr:hypothetical protein GH5_03198 [Leishmania sp. Ghana 2012 LV757]